ncbi:MAG: IPT/TIG domain-containing protein, partial [Bacteroidota bacterium]|nr:IPT/TIG domain-containing protein [Bacteroidota bacterium]
QIKTYAGVGLDDAAASVRLDLTPQGFHAQVLTSGGRSFYIDPVRRTDAQHYLAFYKTDMNRAAAGPIPSCDFQLTPADKLGLEARQQAAGRVASGSASGAQLKTYRLALSNTPEYAVTKGNTLAGVVAGEVATVNRVVGVYEKELAVRMVLVANNDQLVFLSGTGTQPSPAFSNSNGSALLGQNQSNVDRIIGSANYDIGHVVSTGGGGIAGLGVVCNNTRKANGVTGLPNPVGDAFDIDYVAHEMGHQFSGNHPFNGNAGSCAGGNRNANTAWEPGSGTTIMAYAGICTTTNDLQPHSDATFQTGNFQEMRAFIAATSCATTSATGNTAPVVTAPAGGKTMPIGTPFKLTATATDAENDPLTYMWEELDLGPQQAPNDAQVAGQNVPLFRSFVPLTSGTRYFPRLSDLLNNTTVIGERLPTVSRALNFRCTARDEHSGTVGVIGGVDYSALVTLSVSSTAGPFVVLEPNTAVSWVGGAAQTVTWDVANTSSAPVSCATVNIRLSLDGGLTYPTTLATGVPNNGSAIVVAPSPSSSQTQARIMVEAADNYFFDISNANFTITTPAPGPTITSFSPGGGLAGTVVTILGSNFAGTTSVTFNGTAVTAYTVNSATQITAVVPTGATTGPICITAPLGTVCSTVSFIVGPPPTITSFTPTSGPVGTSVVITGTNFTGTTRVVFNTTPATIYTVNSATQITATVPAQATTGPIVVTTPVGTATSATPFTVIPAPVITSFSPTGGLAGTTVVITGVNFTGATAVTFNGIAAPGFVVNSSTQITVSAPVGVTTGPIQVTGPGGTGTSTTNFLVPPPNDLCAGAIALTCGRAPVLGTNVGATTTGDPTATCGVSVQGPGVFYSFVGTGAPVTLSTCNTGTDFDTKLFVYTGACGSLTCVGGIDDGGCTNAQANQYSSTYTFTSAYGVNYYVMIGGYSSASGNFAISLTCATPPATPIITSLTPSSGPIASSFIIEGTGFTGATGVKLNGTTASYTITDAQHITAVVPAGATTGNVVVSVGNGIASNGLLFTVLPAPTVTGLSPASGSVGTTITITGTNFTGATSLTLNGVTITGFVVVNATTITFVVPAGASSGNVVVTTPNGASTGTPFTFTVVSAAAAAQLSEFSVYPNPVAGQGNLHLKLATATTSAQVTLRNVVGQTVATRTFSGTGTELPMSGLATGTYLLTVQAAGRAPSVQRVVVD